MAMDDLTLFLTLVFVAAAAGTVLLSWRAVAPREAGHGEYYALLLTVVLGMVVLAGATNLVTIFIGYELLSIPLYVLCATEMRRATSLESGLKYLIIGSVGSATLLYGLAFVYGATGATDFGEIAAAVDDVRTDVLLLTGLALVVAGLAFKASVAPFHQWTPDVYEGAPTPITAFMAVATKAAALGVIIRFFDVAVIGASSSWAPALAVLALVTIVVGNVGAIGQSSLKRLLAYSSVAQAGYMLAGVVVTTQLGARAVVFYLAVYLLHEHGRVRGDRRARARDRRRRRHLLALRAGRGAAAAGVADDDRDAGAGGLPRDGRLLRQGLPDRRGGRQRLRLARRGDRRRLGDLARVLPARRGGGLDARARDAAGGRRRGAAPGDRGRVGGGGPSVGPRARLPEPAGRQPEVVGLVAVLCAAATIFFGVYPSPLLDLAHDAGAALTGLF